MVEKDVSFNDFSLDDEQVPDDFCYDDPDDYRMTIYGFKADNASDDEGCEALALERDRADKYYKLLLDAISKAGKAASIRRRPELYQHSNRFYYENMCLGKMRGFKTNKNHHCLNDYLPSSKQINDEEARHWLKMLSNDEEIYCEEDRLSEAEIVYHDSARRKGWRKIIKEYQKSYAIITPAEIEEKYRKRDY